MSKNPYESPSAIKAEEEQPAEARTLVRLLLHPANFMIPIAAGIQFLILMNESIPISSVLVGFTLFAGAQGHLFYERVIQQRWVVHVVVLVLFNVGLGFFALGEGALSTLLELPFLIPGAVRWSNPSAALTMSIAMLLVIAVILSHSIRPGFRTALLSALGWGIWYSTSLLALSQAG